MDDGNILWYDTVYDCGIKKNQNCQRFWVCTLVFGDWMIKINIEVSWEITCVQFCGTVKPFVSRLVLKKSHRKKQSKCLSVNYNLINVSPCFKDLIVYKLFYKFYWYEMSTLHQYERRVPNDNV